MWAFAWVLAVAHEGHLAIVQVKQRLCDVVWRPGIEKDIEDMVRKCTACLVCEKTSPAAQPLLQPFHWPARAGNTSSLTSVGSFMVSLTTRVCLWFRTFTLNGLRWYPPSLLSINFSPVHCLLGRLVHQVHPNSPILSTTGQWKGSDKPALVPTLLRGSHLQGYCFAPCYTTYSTRSTP